MNTPAAASVHDFEVTRIDGAPYPLARHRGQVLLIFNSASACGYTPQLTGLQALHQAYAERGLVVLGFPCNQFGRQDPGSNEEIAAFCTREHGVRFPMMARIEVRGPGVAPLFRWLCAQAPGLLGTRGIKWNFTKFLVGRDGQVIRRFGPRTPPAALVPAIEQALRPG